MQEKTIGTFVPLSALWSSNQSKQDYGTFETGIVFLDWLKKTKQSAWQVLPLHETQLEPGSSTKHVSSPYKSYGIGLDMKYLPSSFARTIKEKEKKVFIEQQQDWIMDYALFCALRDYFGTDDWRVWDADIQKREKGAMIYWGDKLREKIDEYILIQFRLHEEYNRLRDKAKSLHITLFGDVPFYLSLQSPLVWAYQDVFQIPENGVLTAVSGIPDTPSAHFGRQVWGHPLYNWNEKNLERILSFWQIRLRYITVLFDSVRLDHAKAFFEYGVIDPKSKKHDRYVKGPGTKFFEKLIHYSQKQKLSLFAEDSGENVGELRASLHTLHISGIKIFRFAFDEKKEKINSVYADISSYPENTISYTTTHDTETLLGYLLLLTKKQKQLLADAICVSFSDDNKELAKEIRDTILSSPAHTVIIPLQDWLLITDRINVPGTETPTNDKNWHFRLSQPIEKLPTSFEK